MSRYQTGRLSTDCQNYTDSIESVTEGHPDKFCDQVSDAVLDECLRQDPPARQPVCLKTAVYGHFGRPEFTWERVDAMEELLANAKYI